MNVNCNWFKFFTNYKKWEISEIFPSSFGTNKTLHISWLENLTTHASTAQMFCKPNYKYSCFHSKRKTISYYNVNSVSMANTKILEWNSLLPSHRLYIVYHHQTNHKSMQYYVVIISDCCNVYIEDGNGKKILIPSTLFRWEA